MQQILVYGDSLSWGLIPNTRRRLPFPQRWPGVLEAALDRADRRVRVIEDCLNGRRTAWEDPFRPGRNGLAGIGQRIEINSPLALVILMLGTNDFQAVHQNNAFNSAQGIAAIVRAIRAAPIEPGMPVPPILIVAPPPITELKGLNASKFHEARRSAGLAKEIKCVAETESCAFFDAGSVAKLSSHDGIHIDADQHEAIGRAVAARVPELLLRD